MSAGERLNRPRRGRRTRIALALAAIGYALFAGSASAAGPQVVVLPTTGVVDSTMAQYLASSIAQAEANHAAAVVIKLNTPGGELSAMNDIVGTLLEAKVPVIVWVAPAGGFAASAGTFITLAANIALMAPGTSIGAASPISGDGTDIPGTLGEKVKNDAIAKITAIAQARGRNVDWAASTVRDARSSPAEEAVSLHAVDGIASSLDEVLAFANGKTVTVGGQQLTLDLTGATTTEQGLNPFLALFRLLADPTIVGILFTVGSAGLIAELWSPNFVTGIIGGLTILLALILSGTLPLNVGGLALLKEWLQKRSIAFSDEARAFGLPAPKGILLLGVQGCGKSLCAKAVSSLWQLPLLRFDMGRMFGSLVGSSEENVRRAIAIAESVAPAILWVDEIDKAFAGSQSSGGTDGGTAARVFGTFLTWLSEKNAPVFVVATANEISQLPPELLRKGRFDEIFFVDLPSPAERSEVLRIHLARRGREAGAFDLSALVEASHDFSGAEIEEAVISALYGDSSQGGPS